MSDIISFSQKTFFDELKRKVSGKSLIYTNIVLVNLEKFIHEQSKNPALKEFLEFVFSASSPALLSGDDVAVTVEDKLKVVMEKANELKLVSSPTSPVHGFLKNFIEKLGEFPDVQNEIANAFNRIYFGTVPQEEQKEAPSVDIYEQIIASIDGDLEKIMRVNITKPKSFTPKAIQRIGNSIKNLACVVYKKTLDTFSQ